MKRMILQTLPRNFLLLGLLCGSLNLPCAFAGRIEELTKNIDDLEDFSHYSARSVQTASREDAFKLLKVHCEAMASYHNEMIDFYKSHIASPSPNHQELKLFLKSILGFDLPNKTPPVQFVQQIIDLHTKFAIIWGERYVGLTGEIKSFGGQLLATYTVLSPSLESSKKILENTKQNFDYMYESSKLRDKLKNSLNNEIFSMILDELWSLRYSHALMLPWTKSDQEIEQEKKEELKREKSRIKNQKKKARKKLAKRNKSENASSSAAALPLVLSQTESELTSVEALEEKTRGETEPNSSSLANTSVPNPTPTAEPLSEGTSNKNHSSMSNLVKNLSIASELPSESNLEKGSDYTEEYAQFVKSQRELSFAKKQQKDKEKVVEDDSVEAAIEMTDPAIKTFKVDKESFSYFMDLFENRKLAFKDFVKAFENGLGGKVYKNRGGSFRVFQYGKYTFNLHKPHKGKGKAMFYDDLRSRALKQLERLGITKERLGLLDNKRGQ